MNVALGSIFRNSHDTIGQWFAQVASLQRALAERGDNLHVIAVENESADDTFERLDMIFNMSCWEMTLVRQADGCPHYPSVDKFERWRHISWVSNTVLDNVTDETRVIYVESDLIWHPKTMLRLLERIDEGYDSMSTMVWHRRPGTYYDTWGSRADGVKFIRMAPYHAALAGVTEPVQMDSVASVLCTTGDIARSTRFQPEDCFVGWCRDIQAKGSKVWLDSSLEVLHP